MKIQVKEENLASLTAFPAGAGRLLCWPVIFSLPVWIETWWSNFGSERYQPALYSVWEGSELIGLAPLMADGKKARLIGSADVCDYLDFITLAGKEEQFFSALLPALSAAGFTELELEAQRPEAAIFTGFFGSSAHKTFRGRFEAENEAPQIILPADWNSYLMQLSKKQRHEVRRKLRKLESESSSYRFRVIGEPGETKHEDPIDYLPLFLDLFLENSDKADFLTDRRQNYFRQLIRATAAAGLARFALLEIDQQPAAALLFFSYAGRVYLYNSGYSCKYAALSAGLISKILLIKDSIIRGKTVFDFLKGPEIYKNRLGGNSVPVYRAIVELS